MGSGLLFAIAAGLPLLVAAWLARQLSGRQFGLDYPRQQSLHRVPVSRLGGVAILAGLTAGGTFAAIELQPPPAFLLIGLCVVAAVSLREDLAGVPVWLRLVAHILAAAQLVWVVSGAIVSPAALVLVFCVVWMINLYNFMDGADGLAGGAAVIGFAAFAALGIAGGDNNFAALALIVAGASLGFLLRNLPPARIFMGDAGSTSLGFLAAALTLLGVQRNLFPVEASLLIFAPLVVDSSITLCRRATRGDRLWVPHRDHYYQRLILAGYGVRRVIAGYHGLMLLGAMSAMLATRIDLQGRVLLLAASAVTYAALLSWVEFRLLRREATL